MSVSWRYGICCKTIVILTDDRLGIQNVRLNVMVGLPYLAVMVAPPPASPSFLRACVRDSESLRHP